VRAVLVYLLALLAAVSAGVSATFPLHLAPIHTSAWKGHSQEFAPKACGWHHAERRASVKRGDTFYEHLPHPDLAGNRWF
jgi:hypothetical protein